MINLQKIQSVDMMQYFKTFVLSILVTAVFYLGFEISYQDNAYAVLLDDRQIGVVVEEALAGEAFDEVKLLVEQEIHHAIDVNEKLSTAPTHASKKEIMDKEKLIDEIKKNITYDIGCYAIKVDGKVQAVLKDEKEAQEVLDAVKKAYIKEGTEVVEASFVEEVEIGPLFVESLDMILTKEEAVSALTKSTEQQKTYTIQEGDTLWSISMRYDMTVEDLLKANPDLEEDSLLQIGQEISLVIPKPVISVMTKEKFTYTEPIEKPVIYKKDDTQYKTYLKVEQHGEEGEKEITAYKVRINGYEEGREIISEKVIREPKEAILIVGTQTPPPKSATGSFKMPVSGTLSSPFGSRWGTFHAGIDLAAPIGTPVYAADGGVVVEAGWHGGYGYLVRIDHGNGFETYYGHTSKIYVTVGQKVAKGEKIAAVGSTGNSTGSHLHFEIRKDGTAKNPYNYLK
ncbi:peptidoglycan DD-metalloendopeptidase family protein [Defluviitalea raffinosedens]|jgi:murein DD-endopeptidase MepM/ murein hydrolase activator NlpD|uniref:Peptidoglycan DD-metalloendopeptidase family protein n=1 Tax=Defluviitalea raffinosedens TaxID=1450156 RepID=A0A7C8HGF6_9FIRM|nr:peptidoglycan DD-metalloendopeptidase family protein [Defluviitalea raffinosedens]KAE9636148.1 peptidoglycan DD-metalloendopeptidase family protein [Defluviitalea raffinosedens]MBM7685000.1 murein DD-endopeptidase MepM/ murein hydrolase activator NlpD [Defluviitalea raffinosedens]MBZ4666928.1 family metallopeptidase [Defluviitaleaceae bacterium]HHW67535.1 peptidoglycan DD-metalloendopeptidase family protein [Candidatus Epulonipiscium sp.]